MALAPARIRVNSVAPGSIEFPGGMWVDGKHNLWVANQTSTGNGFVLEFPPGASMPSERID